MPTSLQAVDAAIREVAKARTLVSHVKSKQIRGADELTMLESLAYAWFNTHRTSIEAQHPTVVDLTRVNHHYQVVLDSTNRAAAKTTYLDALQNAREALQGVRAILLSAPATHPGASNTDDIPPDFSPLVGAAEMRDVLHRRWEECRKCVGAEAHLAAIVMMGGLLEALFVARANKLTNKDPLIKAASAPKDKQTGKTIDYQSWMLDSYLRVGHELEWITDSAKQVGDILKEYRNYIHPAKELRHGVELAHNDSTMFWQITKVLVRQLLLSAPKP